MPRAAAGAMVLSLLFIPRLLWADWVADGASLNVNTGNTASSWAGELAVYNGTPYVAWYEGWSPQQIYVKHFNGTGWEQNGGSLNVDIGQTACYPNLAIDNGTPYVTWMEYLAGTAFQVYVKHWTGSSWVADGGSLNVNTGQWANYPTLAVDNGTPYVTWLEYPAPYQVYVKHWTGGGWVQDGGSLNVNTGVNAARPSIAIYNGTPYVAWYEYPLPYPLYVKHFSGGSWVADGGALNFNPAQGAFYPSIAICNGTPYVAWMEYPTPYQIYVKHWTGSGWVQDGGSLNVDPAQSAMIPCLRIYNGTPYVTWMESNGTASQVIVKHWTGSSWVADGGSLNVNTAQPAQFPALAIDNGICYASWQEGPAPYQLYEKHYQIPSATCTSTIAPTISPTRSPTPVLAATLTPQPSSMPTLTCTQPVAQPGTNNPFFKVEPEIFRPGQGERVRVLLYLEKNSSVKIRIYNLAGSLKATVRDGPLSQGNHAFEWDGQAAGSGTYLIYGEIAGQRVRGKVVLVR